MTGRQIWTHTLGSLATGVHEIVWDGKNTAGQAVATGTYLYRLEHRVGRSATKLLTLVRQQKILTFLKIHINSKNKFPFRKRCDYDRC